MLNILSDPLLPTLLVSSLLCSLLSGVIGSFVVVKRVSHLSGSLAHAVLGGIGFVVWLDQAMGIELGPPIFGAIIMALVLSILIGKIYLKEQGQGEASITALWSFGMALGMIFFAITPGYRVELSSYLMGNLLWITKEDLSILFALFCIVAALVTSFYQYFLLVCFDPLQARLQGLSHKNYFFLLMVMISMTVVVLIQAVGIVLVITILTLPASIAKMFTRSFRTMVVLSSLITMLCFIGGLTLSYQFDLPTGATISCLTSVLYFSLTMCFQRQSSC